MTDVTPVKPRRKRRKASGAKTDAAATGPMVATLSSDHGRSHHESAGAPPLTFTNLTDIGASAKHARRGNALPFEALLAALPHPVCVIGEDDRFAYANPSAEQFFGASAQSLRRQTAAAVVAFGSPLLSLIEQVQRSGASVNEYRVEIALPRADAVRLVDVYCGPMPDDPSHVFFMLQERTVAQMIERQMTHRAAARSVSGLAAMLAHEIKNPLSGIRGAAQLIEPSLTDADRGMAQLICDETDRIRKLVDRMEVFGDDRPMAPSPVNIHDVLEHVRRLAETGFASGIAFDEVYDPSLPAVSGSRDKLVQVLLNLVKNAAEAIGTPTDMSRIRLRTRFRPGIRLSIPGAGTRLSLPLIIEVEDNGPGIPLDLQSAIFDPFVTGKQSGTGLGLALVAKIIGDHGGIVEFDSEPGRTVFRLLMPMYRG
ncbi:MAG: ATP-binding protein [Pseudomonadota bacterium]